MGGSLRSDTLFKEDEVTLGAIAMRLRRGSESRGIPLQIALGVALLAAAVLASPAAANHIAGATYNGTVQGGTAMSFTVSADGSGITSFNAGGPLPGDTCT